MSVISALTSGTPSTQSLLNQTQLVQARQSASQYQDKAQNLYTQARQAQTEAQQWTQKADYLSAQLLQQTLYSAASPSRYADTQAAPAPEQAPVAIPRQFPTATPAPAPAPETTTLPAAMSQMYSSNSTAAQTGNIVNTKA